MFFLDSFTYIMNVKLCRHFVYFVRDRVNDNIESISSITIFILSYIIRVLIDYMTNWKMKTEGKQHQVFDIFRLPPPKKKKNIYISNKIVAFSVFIFQFISWFILYIHIFFYTLLNVYHFSYAFLLCIYGYNWIFISLDYHRCVKIKINSYRVSCNIISKKKSSKIIHGYFKDKYNIKFSFFTHMYIHYIFENKI